MVLVKIGQSQNQYQYLAPFTPQPFCTSKSRAEPCRIVPFCSRHRYQSQHRTLILCFSLFFHLQRRTRFAEFSHPYSHQSLRMAHFGELKNQMARVSSGLSWAVWKEFWVSVIPWLRNCSWLLLVYDLRSCGRLPCQHL